MSENTDIKQFIIVLQHELQKHTDLYDAFRASIQSAIQENIWRYGVYHIDERGLAEKILKCIIGEE